MADITQNTDAKTLQTQAEQLAPYMAQAYKQLSKDVATVTKWGAGESLTTLKYTPCQWSIMSSPAERH